MEKERKKPSLGAVKIPTLCRSTVTHVARDGLGQHEAAHPSTAPNSHPVHTFPPLLILYRSMPFRVKYTQDQLKWVLAAYQHAETLVLKIETENSDTESKAEFYEQLSQNQKIVEVKIIQHTLNVEAKKLSIFDSGVPNVKCLWDARRARLGRGKLFTVARKLHKYFIDVLLQPQWKSILPGAAHPNMTILTYLKIPMQRYSGLLALRFTSPTNICCWLIVNICTGFIHCINSNESNLQSGDYTHPRRNKYFIILFQRHEGSLRKLIYCFLSFGRKEKMFVQDDVDMRTGRRDFLGMKSIRNQTWITWSLQFLTTFPPPLFPLHLSECTTFNLPALKSQPPQPVEVDTKSVTLSWLVEMKKQITKIPHLLNTRTVIHCKQLDFDHLISFLFQQITTIQIMSFLKSICNQPRSHSFPTCFHNSSKYPSHTQFCKTAPSRPSAIMGTNLSPLCMGGVAVHDDCISCQLVLLSLREFSSCKELSTVLYGGTKRWTHLPLAQMYYTLSTSPPNFFTRDFLTHLEIMNCFPLFMDTWQFYPETSIEYLIKSSSFTKFLSTLDILLMPSQLSLILAGTIMGELLIHWLGSSAKLNNSFHIHN
ncbi:hypothetical protein VP01_4198g2 [Puccinia sorghi]|uniref:Uncharacterized protein n=1 Tax=Puccinia sorghi TaxID=27349 RepID=A0A0L6UQS8_9BASI|nr:hypothetical protein VP01_4198g2 [Puccinia sorghi]